MISQISIKNFRSIKELTFEPNNLVALIGPNSSGKTNVLKAIDLVLGEGWTTKTTVARELFNDPRQKITIEIDLSNDIEWNYYSTQVMVNKITLEMNHQPLSCEVRLWSNYPDDNRGNGYYMNNEFKKALHFIYIPSERSLKNELRVSKWTMLGKMMKLVYENYIAHYGDNEQKLKEEFKEKMSQAKNFLENDFSEEITFKKFVDTFKTKCKRNSLGLASDFNPSLDIYNLNWFYKTLQVHVKEDLPDKHFDSEEVGAGMQNLLMISIFQTYSELMGGKVIFGIEEPEIYLYPQAQRSLYKSFIELSEHTQIIYTTHNPNFVNAQTADDMFLLRRDASLGTFKLQKDNYFSTENASNDEMRHKIYTHFNPERNELFFAKKVLFVEGDSDKILFTTLCEEKWDIDLDKLGISVIACGGKGGVNYFLGVCKLIGFEDYFAIWDEDPNDENYNPEKDFLSECLEDNKGLEIIDNLETFLSLPSSVNSRKVKNAFEWAVNVNLDQLPEEFVNIKKFLSEEESEAIEVEDFDKATQSESDDIPF